MAITPQVKKTAPAIIFLFGFLIVILLKIIFNKKYACNGADMRGGNNKIYVVFADKSKVIGMQRSLVRTIFFCSTCQNV